MSVKKRKEKRMWWIAGVVILGILVFAFFNSQKSKREDLTYIKTVPVSNLEIHTRGNKDAPLKIAEYSDFQCPACQYWFVKVKEAEAQYGDKFQLEFHHLPLRSIHPNAQIAAQAAEAAGRQGKFWEMHDLLFERQKEWSQSFKPESLFKQYAKSLGLDERRFAYDMESDEVKDFVNKQRDDAVASGIELSTPTFILDGQKISFEDFVKEYLDK